MHKCRVELVPIPPYGLDLNPVVNLWSIVKHNVEARSPTAFMLLSEFVYCMNGPACQQLLSRLGCQYDSSGESCEGLWRASHRLLDRCHTLNIVPCCKRIKNRIPVFTPQWSSELLLRSKNLTEEKWRDKRWHQSRHQTEKWSRSILYQLKGYRATTYTHIRMNLHQCLAEPCCSKEPCLWNFLVNDANVSAAK